MVRQRLCFIKGIIQQLGYSRAALRHEDDEMVRERGLDVDHSTVFRWVQRYAPEVNKRIRQRLKMSGTSYRVDETYQKVSRE